MRIGCLQFAPQVGDVSNNMNRADSLLSRSNPKIDLLVLPELAFTGYNFSSLENISSHLEPTASGVSSLWARTTALRYNCVVAVGYPEKVETENWQYYNSAIIVNKDGETVANYRKTFLYPRDEAWALGGDDEFFDGTIPGLGYAAMGIGMDINPYRFETPWNVWEFANFILHRQPNLVILSMAWITHQEYSIYSRKPTSPDLGTLSYWVARFEPLIRAEDQGEVIVVITNRAGSEGDAVYAGTSCVIGIEDGEVRVYGILGRGQKELLVVDRMNPPQFKLIAETNTPIYEDKAQSRETLDLTAEQIERRHVGPDTPYPTDEDHSLGLEAAFGEITAVSPVEPLSAHAFFSHSPSKRRGSFTSSESTNTPIASTISSPVSLLGQPGSPASARDSRSPSELSPTSQERLEKMLHIASVFDRQSEPRSAWTPDSASTIASSTWDHSPSAFTPEQFINIIPPSPVVGNDNAAHFNLSTAPSPFQKSSSSNLRQSNQSPTSITLAARGRRSSSSTPSNLSTSTSSPRNASASSQQRIPRQSPAPTLKAPQLPRSRNSSCTRPVQREATIAFREGSPEVVSSSSPELVCADNDNVMNMNFPNPNSNRNAKSPIPSPIPSPKNNSNTGQRTSVSIETAIAGIIIPTGTINRQEIISKKTRSRSRSQSQSQSRPQQQHTSRKVSIDLTHHKNSSKLVNQALVTRGRSVLQNMAALQQQPLPRARSVSPPPTPATALWMGAGAGRGQDSTLWRESRLW